MASKPSGEIFFHTLAANGDLEWQGIVLRELPAGRLEVQLYEWFLGEPSAIKIVNKDDYTWRFYTSEREWVRVGDEFNAQKRKERRP